MSADVDTVRLSVATDHTVEHQSVDGVSGGDFMAAPYVPMSPPHKRPAPSPRSGQERELLTPNSESEPTRPHAEWGVHDPRILSIPPQQQQENYGSSPDDSPGTRRPGAPARNSSASSPSAKPRIDCASEKFPFCIVWCAIPCFTWVFPVAGHMGLGDASGEVHEWVGVRPTWGEGLAFGPILRYIPLDPRRNRSGRSWDEVMAVVSRRWHGRIFLAGAGTR